MNSELLPRRLRVPVLLVALAAATMTTVLGWRFSDQDQGSALDSEIQSRVARRLGNHPEAIWKLIQFGDPSTVAVLTVALVLLCLLLQHWRGAALATVAVPGAAFLGEFVFKPLFDRRLGGSLSYPSGHATGAFAVATVICVLMIRGTVPPIVRALVALSCLALASGVAAALVAVDVHYPSDTVGGAGLAVATVLGVSLLVDLIAAPKT